MISSNDMRFISQAAAEANKSPVLMRHGAVAVAHGKVFGRGYNHYRSTSKDLFINNTCTCHAEIASLRNMFYCCSSNTYGKHSKNIKGVYKQYKRVQRNSKHEKALQKNHHICSAL